MPSSHRSTRVAADNGHHDTTLLFVARDVRDALVTYHRAQSFIKSPEVDTDELSIGRATLNCRLYSHG